jgi:hypothetical protein
MDYPTERNKDWRHFLLSDALICSNGCSFAYSMLITMTRIMTDPENQFQTHFILEDTVDLLTT